MHNVTDEQIDFILDDIAKKGIRTEDVRYNILDHVCCIIENEMPAGANFYEFYKNTIARFYKKQLKEIELLVDAHDDELIGAWQKYFRSCGHEYFGPRRVASRSWQRTVHAIHRVPVVQGYRGQIHPKC